MNKIPKTFHQVWLWNTNIPTEFLWYQNWWIVKHPSWKLIVWNEKNIPHLKHYNKQDFNKLVNFSEKSDYLRMSILLEFWWVYIDTDMECLQSIDRLIQRYTFFVWKDNNDKNINTAIIWSIPEGRIIKKIYKGFSKQIFKYPKIHDFNKIGPFYVDKIIQSISLKNTEKIFSRIIFYPISNKDYFKWIEVNRTELIMWWAYSIHHYTYSWSKLLSIKNKYLYRFPLIRIFFREIWLPLKNYFFTLK
jgi:mannosyltransferase OCH1-like enzyme